MHSHHAVIWFLWTAFFHAAEAKTPGICQAIFVTLIVPPWTAVDPIVIALPISLAVMILLQWQSGKQQPSKTATAAG